MDHEHKKIVMTMGEKLHAHTKNFGMIKAKAIASELGVGKKNSRRLEEKLSKN